MRGVWGAQPPPTGLGHATDLILARAPSADLPRSTELVWTKIWDGGIAGCKLANGVRGAAKTQILPQPFRACYSLKLFGVSAGIIYTKIVDSGCLWGTPHGLALPLDQCQSWHCGHQCCTSGTSRPTATALPIQNLRSSGSNKKWQSPFRAPVPLPRPRSPAQDPPPDNSDRVSPMALSLMRRTARWHI